VPILPDNVGGLPGELLKLVYLTHNATTQPVVLDSLGQVFTLNGRINIDEVIIDLRAGFEHYAVLTKQGNLYIGSIGSENVLQRAQKKKRRRKKLFRD